MDKELIDKEPKNNADNEVIFIKHPSWQDEDDLDIAQHLAFLNSLSNEHSEPKFKVGDKVKDISSPHDDGINKVDDIKKSSDGFIYHIQGLIGKSNVKESDLKPYTEPGKEESVKVRPKSVEELRIADEGTAKSDSSRKERLNIAAMAMQAILISERREHATLSPKEIAQLSLEYAEALIAEIEKKGDKQ